MRATRSRETQGTRELAGSRRVHAKVTAPARRFAPSPTPARRLLYIHADTPAALAGEGEPRGSPTPSKNKKDKHMRSSSTRTDTPSRRASTRIVLGTAALLASTVLGCSGAGGDNAIEARPLDSVAYEGVRIIAAVARPNGGIVRFLASEDGEGAGCDEIVPADGMSAPASSASDPRDCLALFIDLTADDVPVPEALVASSEAEDVAKLVAHRNIVEEVPETISSAEPEITPGLHPLSGDDSTTPHSCDGANGSQDHFENEHCDSSGGSDVIEYCDSGQWFDLYRTTAGSTRKSSFEEVLVCGTHADVIHEYWNGTSWPNVYTVENIPSGHFHWSRWQGLAKWQRRVHVYRVWATGFFRSHSVFYN